MIIFAVQDDFGYFSTGDEAKPFLVRCSNGVINRVLTQPFELFYRDVFGEAMIAQKTIDSLVNKIYSIWEKNPGNIDCLFLVAHGNAGVLNICDGLGKVRSAKFAKLKGTFNANSRGIRIHGCACASSTDIGEYAWSSGEGTQSSTGKGYEFLKSLSVNSGVKVTAPIDSVSGFNAGYSYKDVRTMTVTPDGKATFSNNK